MTTIDKNIITTKRTTNTIIIYEKNWRPFVNILVYLRSIWSRQNIRLKHNKIVFFLLHLNHQLAVCRLLHISLVCWVLDGCTGSTYKWQIVTAGQGWAPLAHFPLRSKLEYGSVIWHPHLQKDTHKIEKLQSRFLRLITFKATGYYPKFDSYTALLSTYNISPLENRRLLTDIMFLYKILNNKIDCMELTTKVTIRVPSLKTRSLNNCILHCRKANSLMLNRSPMWRISSSLNKIIIIDPTVDMFFDSEKQLRTKLLNIQKGKSWKFMWGNHYVFNVINRAM